MKSSTHTKGLRAIAILEASKGIVVLLIGIGILINLGADRELALTHLFQYLHLNPTGNYTGRFIRAIAGLEFSQLVLLVILTLVYSTVRFLEAYGLWRQRRWAEWIAALGSAIYVPVELYELYHRPSWISVTALLINLGILAYMVWILRESQTRNPTGLRKDLTDRAEV